MIGSEGVKCYYPLPYAVYFVEFKLFRLFSGLPEVSGYQRLCYLCTTEYASHWLRRVQFLTNFQIRNIIKTDHLPHSFHHLHTFPLKNFHTFNMFRIFCWSFWPCYIFQKLKTILSYGFQFQRMHIGKYIISIFGIHRVR